MIMSRKNDTLAFRVLNVLRLNEMVNIRRWEKIIEDVLQAVAHK